MDWFIVRLKFRGPLHIGQDEPGVGIEGVQPCIHSDTLFSAFCNTWASNGAGEKTLSKIKEGKIPLRFSSAFFYHKERDGAFTYFLPRPLLPASTCFDTYAQVVKKTGFISLDQFKSWARGDVTDDISAMMSGIGYADYRALYIEQVRPRHSSSRVTMTSAIYHCGEVFFQKEGGLYFLVETGDAQILRDSLRCLRVFGLGGERSTGYGAFDYDPPELIAEGSPFHQLKQIQGNAWCLLSVYYPNENEMGDIQRDALAYNLVLRKGWFYSKTARKQGKRKTCRMFAEGSLFRSPRQGCVLNVKPKGLEHAVFRSGLAMGLPMRIQEA
jgi:CRISPR-associated protein Csm4